MSSYLLSKSTYLRGIQCHKSLYLNKFKKELRDEKNEQEISIFEQGTEVGKLAHKLYANGVNVLSNKEFNLEDVLKKTDQYIKETRPVIFEAHFLFDEILCAVDILVFDGNKYNIIEVKSSTTISDVNYHDVSLQYYVLKNCGLNIDNVSIAYINNQYIRKDNIEPHKLFLIESIFNNITSLQTNIKENISEFKKVLQTGNEPKINIGNQCLVPYQCDFIGYCWKHIPKYSIFDIANLRIDKKFELYNKGIIELHQIDAETEHKYLNSKQSMQLFSELEQRSYIDKKNIKAFTESLNYPLCFLDFETINSAIPLFNNTRPYQQIVFQYSLHYLETKNSDLNHTEYLAETDGTDPRFKFIEHLINDCGKKGDILTYNMTFEKTRLKELSEDFPKYKTDLEAIIDRLKDLMIPFKERWYYTPEMKGSYSIKYVLPALVPELSYKDLEIQNGSTAMVVFTQMINGIFTGDIEKTRKELLKYCYLDTFAMVKILEVLNKINTQ